MAANHAAIMRITSRTQHEVSRSLSETDSISKHSDDKIKSTGSLPAVVNLEKIENLDEINYFLGKIV